MKNLVCPISDQRVNEYVIRLNALLTVGFVLLGFLTNSGLVFIFLMTDFFVRAFTEVRFSPISLMSKYMSNTINLPTKMIDKAPKVFAARLGFIMTAAIAGLFVFDLKVAAIVVSSVLIFFATLEFAFALCVGCLIYTYLILPFYNK